MYRQALELTVNHDAQLDRWLGLNLSHHQLFEIKRLIELNQVVRARVERILDLCDDIKKNDLDRDFMGDDYQSAIDAFMDNPAFQESLSDEEVLRIVEEINEFVGKMLSASGGDDDIINHPQMMDCAMKFQRVIARAKPGETDALVQMYPGFGHFGNLFQTMIDLMMQFKERI
jgi:hypothetical protein